jgi:RNA polymerase sigma-70 factor, ECF subfamily
VTAAESEAGTASAPGRIPPASRLEHEAARARTDQLFREHGRMVRGLCSGLLRDRAEADDAAQQTFLAAHGALLRGGDPREPAAWLAAIARNECLARVRERMREPLPTLELRSAVSTSDPVTTAIARGDLRAMWQAVSELSPQQQRAFVLREFGGLSYEELAVALGVSTGAIESLLFRARSRLRSRLETVLASFGAPAWLAAVRDLVPRWLDAGAATKVAAATAATVVAGGTFVGERELIHPRHAASAPSALHSSPSVERAAVVPTPVAAPTTRSLERRRPAAGRRASVQAARTDDDAEAAEVDRRRGGGSGERSGSGRNGPAPAATSTGGDRAAPPEAPRTGGSDPASESPTSSGERGPGGGSEGPGSSDSSGTGSSGEGSGEPEGLSTSGETSGSGSSSASSGSSGSDKGGSGSDGVDSDGSGSGKGGSGLDDD